MTATLESIDVFENHLFTEYLEETKDKIVGEFTTLKWLQWLDDDTIKMLSDYTEQFSNNVSEDDINEDEATDILMLVRHLIVAETDKPSWMPDAPDVTDFIPPFVALVVLEGMRRKKLVNINGSGKLVGDNTTYDLTNKGRTIQTQL